MSYAVDGLLGALGLVDWNSLTGHTEQSALLRDYCYKDGADGRSLTARSDF
jgi:hypothetical protein